MSFCLCFRNDNYGGDQTERFRLFIDYYSRIQKKYDGYFEFVVCDYNSPVGDSVHKMNLPWGSLHPVKFIIINAAHHEKLSKGMGRPILDYVGRNIAVRHASGRYVLILNQDIFITDSIFEFCLEQKLKENFFYRADRWDIKFDAIRRGPVDQLIFNAKNSIQSINRRHSPKYKNITVPCKDAKPADLSSQPLDEEKYDTSSNVIYGEKVTLLQQLRHRLQKPVAIESLGLHTNASGDFILCSKKAWEKIRGAYETTEFYMHLDSYLIAQLYGVGFRQAIFDLPHQVFHADHDRSARLNFQESIPFEVHKKRLADIALGKVTPRLNTKNWGMQDESLAVIEI